MSLEIPPGSPHNPPSSPATNPSGSVIELSVSLGSSKFSGHFGGRPDGVFSYRSCRILKNPTFFFANFFSFTKLSVSFGRSSNLRVVESPGRFLAKRSCRIVNSPYESLVTKSESLEFVLIFENPEPSWTVRRWAILQDRQECCRISGSAASFIGELQGKQI